MESTQFTVDLNKTVSDWSQYLKNDLIKSIHKKKVSHTGALAKSISYKVIQGANGPEKIVFTFLHYGKFVDMGVGRGQKLGDVKGNAAIYSALGTKGRKAKKWYSKTIFPEANTLAKILAEKYGIHALDIINDNLPDKIQ